MKEKEGEGLQDEQDKVEGQELKEGNGIWQCNFNDERGTTSRDSTFFVQFVSRNFVDEKLFPPIL